MPAKSKSKSKLEPNPLPPTTTAPAASDEARLAFETMKADIAALDPTDLAPINIDIPRAVAVALGVVTNLAPYHPMLAKLPDYDFARVKNLRTYALAALHAHLAMLPVKANLDDLLAEATQLKQTLLVAADALADRKLFDPARIAQIRAGSGHVDLASDCVALGALYEERWNDIASKTAVTKDEVSRASVLGTALLEALGARQATIPAPDATDRRQRAFSRFLKVYDEASRGITFLRWDQNDVEEIVPSLYQKTRRPRRNAPIAEPGSPPIAPTAKPNGSNTANEPAVDGH